MIEITGSERKDNKKGRWLVLTGKSDKGEDRTWNTFDGKVIDSFKGPGKYEASFVKKGEYWNLATLELVGGSPAVPPVAQVASVPQSAPAALTARPARVDIAVAALEAASRIVAAQSAGKNSADVLDETALAFRVLAKEAKEFVTGREVAEKKESYQSELVEGA